ncbi:MAG: hypothetical protein JW709_04105, partial [Sedimentisphaerales bacterium]|nr:hypothetical protein [Sedimentisphaerales bacterium]
ISPGDDWGRYETRPVYGYDDCFPTVSPCESPGGGYIPDHGEICWLPWDIRCSSNALIGWAQCQILPVRFCRLMEFHAAGITWRFEVENQSNRDLPFLHVMHALLPPNNVTALRLPTYETLYDEMTQKSLPHCDVNKLSRDLCITPQAAAKMLLLQNIQNGFVEIEINRRYRLGVHFDAGIFTTLGIWWNNGGYPPKNACRRFECAFEPIPGESSSLVKARRHGTTLMAPARGKLSWTVKWEITLRDE